MKRKTKLEIRFWITLFIGISFSYFVWLLWKKLTTWIGDSIIVLIITGTIVLLGILFGFFSFKRIAKKFTT